MNLEQATRHMTAVLFAVSAEYINMHGEDYDNEEADDRAHAALDHEIEEFGFESSEGFHNPKFQKGLLNFSNINRALNSQLRNIHAG
jgi:hypothetical protein